MKTRTVRFALVFMGSMALLLLAPSSTWAQIHCTDCGGGGSGPCWRPLTVPFDGGPCCVECQSGYASGYSACTVQGCTCYVGNPCGQQGSIHIDPDLEPKIATLPPGCFQHSVPERGDVLSIRRETKS